MSRTGKKAALLLGLIMLLAAVFTCASAAENGWVEHEVIVSFRPEAVSDTADMERILAGSLDAGFELVSPTRVDAGLVIGLVRCPALSADELSSALAANKDMGHLLVGFWRIGVSAGRTVWRSVDGRCIIGECSDGFL